jgi:hypothetical protein
MTPADPSTRGRLSTRQRAVQRVLLAWAEEHAPDATVTEVTALTRAVVLALPHGAIPPLHPTRTPKGGATPDDARRIAARMEETWPRGETVSTYRVNCAELVRLLEDERCERGVSWNRLAEETGLARSTFTRLKAGGAPDAHALLSLLEWLGRDGPVRDLMVPAGEQR